MRTAALSRCADVRGWVMSSSQSDSENRWPRKIHAGDMRKRVKPPIQGLLEELAVSSSSPMRRTRSMYGARAVKGMVAVAGRTYRIVRIEAGHYAAVRLLDDVQVGTFHSYPKLAVYPTQIESALLLAIARQAIHGAKTSWVGSIQPSAAPGAGEALVERSSSSGRMSSNPPPRATG
jgi:hypothetical protein